MRKLFTSLLLTLLIAAFACADVGLAYVVDRGGSHEVVTTKITSIERVAGKDLTLQLSGFAGVGSKDRPLGGFALTFRARPAANVFLDLGPAVHWSSRKPSGLCGYIGVSIFIRS